jgi:aminoglycoside/choline kinase family phosphotransferase
MDTRQLPAPWVRESPLAGDASTRRYSRVWDPSGATAIMVRYPEDVRGQIVRDLETRSFCERHGVRVPSLLAHPEGSDWAVVEDLGPADAEHTLTATPAGGRLELMLRTLVPLASLASLATSELPGWNAPLDAVRLRWELAGFELWFLRHRCGARPSAAVVDWLDGLATEINLHPKRICHRDFHLNNLFFLARGEVGVIDFQDILVGPDTYDMVSLLNERATPDLLDPRVRNEVGSRWAQSTFADPGWKFRAHRVRLQRALKVLGTFARFEAAGKTDYVPWMLGLARELVPDLQAGGAPPALIDRLLDL